VGKGVFALIDSAFGGPKDDESEEDYLNEHGLNWDDLESPKDEVEWDGSLDEPPETNWDD